MRAGQLDRQVRLLRHSPGSDNGIEIVPGGFEAVATRFARVMPEYRAEKLQALGLVGQKVIRVWLRFESVAAQIDSTWALEYQGEPYELVGVPTEIGRREGLELVAVASDIEIAEVA